MSGSAPVTAYVLVTMTIPTGSSPVGVQQYVQNAVIAQRGFLPTTDPLYNFPIAQLAVTSLDGPPPS